MLILNSFSLNVELLHSILHVFISVPGFKEATEGAVDAISTTKLRLLSSILHLTDLSGNRSNYGRNEKNELVIFDFRVFHFY